MNEPAEAAAQEETLPSSARRALLLGGGVAAAAASAAAVAPQPARAAAVELGDESTLSPWGANPKGPPQPLPRGTDLPGAPRPYTEISSYHAHIYFNEDTAYRAARLRDWVIDRFRVELGDWNEGPRGPHTTPSFYFGFATEQVPTVVPWLMLNHLGLKILIHPNTDDPYADHLINALWIGDTQPVNAFRMARSATAAGGDIERIYPNTLPTVSLET
ncbi:DOPA 4,5-dioxygenase family protein [Brevundimonas faecalis]|uniref:Aromatic ring-cleaving dioxygenase n=1 Tax=Brevundimonas faecalis TaxID=947378 RepID=A0ABV2RA07_9CAUL